MLNLIMVAAAAVSTLLSSPGDGDPRAPCCGPITARGRQLAAVLDAMHVEDHWLAHEHVNWKSGDPDRGPDYTGSSTSTHCSAFAAAVGYRLNVYMLRPPEHGQLLLASAQTQWFGDPDGANAGWREVNFVTGQRLANEGQLVVISYANHDPHRPGHIVIVRPSLKSNDAFAAEGPQVIQAATVNKPNYPASRSFNAHPGAWPDRVHVYAHPIDWRSLPDAAPSDAPSGGRP